MMDLRLSTEIIEFYQSSLVKIDKNRPMLSDRAGKDDFPVKFQIRRSQYEEFAIYLFTKVTHGIRRV